MIEAEFQKGGETMSKRIDWPTYFIMQAVILAARSTCTRLHVGAVLVKNGRIIASGYNGSVTGTPHCDEVGDLLVDGHCIRAVHAEQNVLMQCAKMGIAADGAEIYVTDFPCPYCTKLLLQAGIKKINYLRNYHNDEFARELLSEKQVAVEQVPLTETDLKSIHFKDYVTSN
ncbi:dCMP deaminase [Weissella halotolerans DSM 20190]|uniref:dCMP deaminase n=2 Tax=Weissella halotolerans TaxID=1615 RepID=A0A0R2FPX5_9LACO|nr:dCMP deaminase [Weissella halotolerans DSM 20190]